MKKANSARAVITTAPHQLKYWRVENVFDNRAGIKKFSGARFYVYSATTILYNLSCQTNFWFNCFLCPHPPAPSPIKLGKKERGAASTYQAPVLHHDLPLAFLQFLMGEACTEPAEAGIQGVRG
jgi:hypothetical protein